MSNDVADKSYIGSGNILIREYGAAAPLLEIGNCSAFSFSPQEDVKQQQDFTTPGGGLRNQVRRLTGVDVTWTFHDFTAENFARGLRADVATITAGTATDEAVVAYKGGYTPLAKIATSITSVEPHGGGTAYTAGTDYEYRDGQLYIPSGSSIPAPVAGAANVDVTYAYAAQKRVEALVNSNKIYEVVFMGLNEAQSGKTTRIRCHKVNGGLLQQMAVIGDDYGAGEVQGALQSDSTKGVGLSKYMVIETED
jgi:hypothetical protein